MVEKPISAHKAAAERLIAVHRLHPKLVFAAMFQMRTESRYRKIKEIISGGQLGEIIRLSWIITEWFRTEAYYAGSHWRGTWKGDGGGVLINQCLHQLDLLQWLLGMPARVRGFAQLGRFHHIEVEDDVTAYMEFPNRATGTFISTTGEAPGTNRLEISGEMGKLLLENDRLLFMRNEVSTTELCKTGKLGFQKPDIDKNRDPHSAGTRATRHADPKLYRCHPRRHSPHSPRRGRHPFDRTGQCHVIFGIDRPDCGLANGRHSLPAEA